MNAQTNPTALLSRAQIAKRYRRRPEWVAAHLPSVPDPENARRQVYSVTAIEAYFDELGRMAARGAA